MIYAESEKGERISALQCVDLLKKERKNKSNSNFYYCPGCKGKVFLKNGTQKIPHFSHYNKINCHSFSEGETEAHLKGKLLLQKWCLSQGLTVEMEAWLPSLQQRPDLLITLNNNTKLALEYQCSPISYEKLVERTEGYHSMDYQVLWICGMEYVPTAHLLRKHTNFLIWSRETGAGFLCLDTHLDSFIKFYNFEYNDDNQLKWNYQQIKVKQINLEKLLNLYSGDFSNKTKRTFADPAQYKTKNHRFHLLHKKDLEHRLFLEQIYLRRQDLHGLPDFLFQYPTHSIFFHTPSYIWKYFFLCWLKGKEEGAIVDKNGLLDFILACRKERLIRIRALPLNEQQLFLLPIYFFINELVKKGIMIIIGDHLWLVSKPSLLKLDQRSK